MELNSTEIRKRLIERVEAYAIARASDSPLLQLLAGRELNAFLDLIALTPSQPAEGEAEDEVVAP